MSGEKAGDDSTGRWGGAPSERRVDSLESSRKCLGKILFPSTREAVGESEREGNVGLARKKCLFKKRVKKGYAAPAEKRLSCHV